MAYDNIRDFGNEVVSVAGMLLEGVDNITITHTARGISAPVESGRYVFDNKVLMPATVSVRAILDCNHWQDTYSKLYAIYLEKSYEFTWVNSRGEYIENLMMESLSHSDTSEKFDAVEVNMKFTEVVITRQDKIALSANSQTQTKTKDTGIKSLTKADYDIALMSSLPF